MIFHRVDQFLSVKVMWSKVSLSQIPALQLIPVLHVMIYEWLCNTAHKMTKKVYNLIGINRQSRVSDHGNLARYETHVQSPFLNKGKLQ